jgi:hypothetical protein
MELFNQITARKHKILVISSEDKIYSTDNTNQFTVQIRPAINHATRVTLAWAIIPNSTYNINQYNNQLYFTDGGGAHTLTITSGSYNTTNLGSTIAAAMTAAGSQAYTLAYNPITYH